MDINGRVLRSFTDVLVPHHLSLDSEGRVLIANYGNDHILLLSSELQLQRVLIDRNSQIKLRRPTRLCYNELTSQLYVAHLSWWSPWWPSDHDDGVISVFRLR